MSQNLLNLSSTTPAAPSGSQLALWQFDANGNASCYVPACIPSAQAGAPSGVATLDSTGKIPVGQLPPLAIEQVYVVASQAAMLALACQQGDIAVRTDLSETFILSNNDPTQLANWVEILAPPGVSSVGLSAPSEFTVSGSPVTTSGVLAFSKANQNANTVWAGPAAGSAAQPGFRSLVIADLPTIPASQTSGFAPVATSGSYSDLTNKPTIPSVPVSSVFGRIGAVSAATGDYSFAQISGSVAGSQLPAPNATTLGGVQSLAAAASKWINAISTSGVPSATQPAFSDISGMIAAGQVPTLNQNTTGTASNVTGIVALANGGTGQSTASAAFNALMPMTTLGDLVYASGANTAARLAGNITTAKLFLAQTGTGSASAAPAWASIALTDLPTIPVSQISGLGTAATTASSAYDAAGAATAALSSAQAYSANASNLSSGTVAAARLPLATTSIAGAVIVGSNLNVSAGTISVNASAFDAAGAAASAVAAIPNASGSATGLLKSSDWTVFNTKQAALGFTPLNAASNLSDVGSAAAALANLGGASLTAANVFTAGIATITAPSSNAQFQISSTSNSGYIGINTISQQSWTFGVDRSDSGKFKFSPTYQNFNSSSVVLTPGGNVGIANAAPGSLLTVGAGSGFTVDGSGNVAAAGNITQTGSGFVQVRGGAGGPYPSSGAGLELIYDTTAGVSYLQSYDRGAAAFKSLTLNALAIPFQISGVERMRIAAGGNVLIGTTTDNGTDKLQVAGSINSTGNVKIPSGALLVGVASSSAYSHVKGISDTTACVTQILQSDASGHGTVIQYTDGATYNYAVGSDGSGNFAWYAGRYPGTAGTERMRLTQSGNVLVGTTTDNGTDKLQVAGSINASGAITGALGGWQTWTPTVTGAGSMTVSSLVVNDAQYIRMGPMIYYKLSVTFTLGGTAANTVLVGLPVPQVGNTNFVQLSYIATGTGVYVGGVGAINGGTSNLNGYVNNQGNWALGASVSISSEGFYRCA